MTKLTGVPVSTASNLSSSPLNYTSPFGDGMCVEAKSQKSWTIKSLECGSQRWGEGEGKLERQVVKCYIFPVTGHILLGSRVVICSVMTTVNAAVWYIRTLLREYILRLLITTEKHDFFFLLSLFSLFIVSIWDDGCGLTLLWWSVCNICKSSYYDAHLKLI